MAVDTRERVKPAPRPLPLRIPGIDQKTLQGILTKERSKPILTRTAAFFTLTALGTAWIPFYPLWMTVFLGFVLAGVSLRFPVLSLVLLSVLVTAAAGYQRAEFGLLMLVISLLLSVAALFDWKFSFLVMGVLFLSRFGLGILPPVLASMLFPAFLAVSATAVSGILLTLLVTCGNFQVFGFLVSAPHPASFLVFSELPSSTFAPQDIGAGLGQVLKANPDIMGGVLASNLGASLLPFAQVVVWCLAIYLLALLTKKRSLADWTTATVVGGILLVGTFLASALVADVPLGLGGWILPLGLVALVAGGTAVGYDARERFREYFVAREGLAHVGTRLADLPEARSSFRNVGGLADVKADLKESILVPLLHPQVAEAYKISPARGILLFGPPGCGKTLLMTALAGELQVEMVTVKASDIMSKWYGESEGKIDQLFRVAKERRPCIIFIDDIDAIAKSRDLYAGDDVTPRLLGMILAEIDGMDKAGGMIMVGTTNKPELVDPALLRPGRFDKIIYVPPPDRRERRDILKVHLRGRPTAKDLPLDLLAGRTERFSGADLANLVTEASRRAMKRSLASGRPEPVMAGDFTAILDDIKPSISIASIEEYERLRLAYERKMHHEDRTAATPLQEVAGLDAVRRDLATYLHLALRQPERLAEFHLRAARGVLLFGPRGCGKTHLVRAAARELGVTLQTLSVPLLLASSDAAAEMKRLFYLARENAPGMILVDDIDQLGQEGKDARSLQAQFLALVDGMLPEEKVLVVAATSRPLALGDALFGFGRFERAFFVPPPDSAGRRSVLESRLASVPADVPPEPLDSLARRTEGFSHGDLVALVDEAKMLAVRADAPVLTPEHLEGALSRVRPSVTADALRESEEFSRSRSVRL